MESAINTKEVLSMQGRLRYGCSTTFCIAVLISERDAPK
jgi:hypothetical protein